MEIILLERVDKLGKLGDVVKVKPGYARNYLLPTGKALRANKANMEKFEAERADRESRNAEARSSAEDAMKGMGGLSVILVRAASEMGQLFGSVSARDIADAVGEAGHSIDKRQVVMDKAIKTLGLFPVKVNLHAEVQVEVIVNIARSAEEAKKQAETGAAVVTNYDAEEESVEAVADAAITEAEANAEVAEEAPVEAEAGDSDDEAAS
ncbi:MAG: 50S ribosomal protein L9 [Alphaproteobacteria bacterium]|nr:50S ribosomal protein L9 [Alphaproteobacteria bacterium]MBL6776984.1 50S ribosomal protein L9 [Alphaproteobacteria bacterium]